MYLRPQKSLGPEIANPQIITPQITKKYLVGKSLQRKITPHHFLTHLRLPSDEKHTEPDNDNSGFLP
jgi:hypothetical protein